MASIRLSSAGTTPNGYIDEGSGRQSIALGKSALDLLNAAPVEIGPGSAARGAKMQDRIGHRNHDRTPKDKDTNITISSTSKLAGQNVAPFLAKHIPNQYAPLGAQAQLETVQTRSSNTKYCYRHRPDLKCRRQADEPSMEQLQNLSFVSASIRDLIRIDFLTALPPEISFKILCYLDTTSLCKAAQVSQRWRSLADDDVVWHKMCEQHIDRKCTKCGWGLPLLERKRLRASKRQIQLRATGKGLNVWSPDITPFPESAPETSGIHRHHEYLDPSKKPHKLSARNTNGKREAQYEDFGFPSLGLSSKRSCVLSGKEASEGSYFRPRFRPWKDVYKDRFKVGTNWKYGRCSTKMFKGHTNGVMCLQFDDSILASGSYDSTIKIWDVETGEELRTLRGHESGIRCLQFDDTKLISGSIDRSLKVWNWRTGECISTYTGHSGGVISLHFDSTILASGSMDKSIKIWNFEDKSTFLLRGHTDWVNAVRVDSASRTVFSASDDCTVRLWDLDSKSCLKIFEGHVGQVQQVLPLPSEFEFEFEFEGEEVDDKDDRSSTASGEDLIGVLRNGLSPSKVYGEGFTGDRSPPPRYMLTGALDSTIRLWDVSTGKCLRTFFGHVEGVWALAVDTLRVVSGAEDRMVKVWDARTGKCERTFTGHAGPVTCIGLSDSRMCTGSEDCEIRLYSFKPENSTLALVEESESDISVPIED
ncbi:MAG: hypothetical protein M1827_002596 [Pycnora praestabilis]|nr:MAG: hypothetical protein M1827_002596 [Pycnora praestabilis]